MNDLSPQGKYPEVIPPTPSSPTYFEQLQAQEQYKKTRPGYWEAISGTTLAYDVGAAIGSSFIFDDQQGWKDKNRPELMELLSQVPYNYHDDILSAGSLAEAIYEKSLIDDKAKFIRRVGDAGIIGYSGMIGINLLEGAALGAATFGAAAPALVGLGYRGAKSLKTISSVYAVARASNRAGKAAEIAQAVTRMSLFGRGAAVGTIDALAYTAIDAAVDPTVEAHDFAFAGAFGSILGGTFNAMTGRSLLASRLVNLGRRYEDALLSRGVELPARFGADDMAAQIARRYNVPVETAHTMMSFFDQLDIDMGSIAVGGRLVGEDVGKVRQSLKFTDKGVLLGGMDVLEDGRIILRSFFDDNQNNISVMRGMAGVLRRRLFNADIPETNRGGITDNEIRQIDEWLEGGWKGRQRRIREGSERGQEGDLSAGFVRDTTEDGPRRLVRTADWSNADETKFANAFFRWMLKGEKDGVPETLIPIFEKVRLILAKTFDGVSDPRLLGGKKMNPKLQEIFERVLAQQVASKAAREHADIMAFQRAVAGGGDDGLDIPDGEATGSLSSWDDIPRIFGIEGFGAKFTSQAISAMTAPIGKIRWLAMQMHFTRVAPRTNDAARRMVAQPTTINEFVHRIKAVTELRLLRAFNKGLNEFLSDGRDFKEIGKVERMKNLFRHERRRQFNEMVYEEIHAPGSHDNPQVTAVAAAWRKEMNVLRELAKKSKVKGFEALAEDATYFPRLYKWSAIDGFMLKYGQPELKKLLYNALDKTEMSADEADALAELLAERLIRLARGERKSGTFNLNQQVQEILATMARPSTPAGPILTPRVRYRFRADILSELTDGSRASLSDLVERDVTIAFGSYVRSVAGAIGETKLINRYKSELLARGTSQEAVDKIATWGDMIDDIKKSSRSLPVDEMDSYVESLNELRASMRSEPDPSSFGTGVFNTVFSENARRLMKIAYLQRGGSFALAQFTEMARTISRAGFTNVWKQMPVVQELLDSARQGRQVNELSSLMEQIFGVGSDRIRRTTGRIDDSLNSYPPAVQANWYRRAAQKLAKVDEKLDALVFAFADMSGLAPLTSATQHLTAMSLLQRLYSNSQGKGKKFGEAIIRQWGLEEPQYNAMIAAVGRHAELDGNGRVVNLKLENFGDAEFRSLMTFLERGTIATIQDPPVRGDLHKFFFSPLGKMLIQFRTFNTKGVDAFLRTSIQRKDADMMREYLMTGILAMMTQTFRKQLRYSSITDKKEKAKFEKENFSPGAYASYFMSGPTENYLLMIGTDSLSQFFLGQSTFGSRVRYSGLSSSPFDVSGTPAWAAIDSAYKSVQGPARAMLNSDYDFSRRDLHAIFNSLPAARAVGVGEALSKLETFIGSGLPEESKKGQK